MKRAEFSAVGFFSYACERISSSVLVFLDIGREMMPEKLGESIAGFLRSAMACFTYREKLG